MNCNTLLVGGGITSSLIGFCLRKHKHIVTDLWEKEEEIGGRMRTFHSEHTQTETDIGAQYITSSDTLLHQNEDIYNSLFESGKIKPLTCRIDNLRLPDSLHHYVAPMGMSSLVQHFIDSAKLQNIHTSYSVKNLNILPDMVEVETDNGVKELYKAIVLTLPVPSLFELSGNFKEKMGEEISAELKKVKYSSRFVLVLIYNYLLRVEWAANYTPRDKIFRYVGIQEKKVGISSGCSSVVFHTSVEFGERYHNSEEASLILMERVRELFPQWKDPVDVFCYKWHYSQVVTPFRNTPGHVVLSSKPPIIITGDGFTTSNFDGCIESANSTVDTLLKLLQNSAS